MDDFNVKKRNKKTDKSKKTYEKYGKYTTKNVRIKENLLDKNKSINNNSK
jgi:hypothetical protein